MQQTTLPPLSPPTSPNPRDHEQPQKQHMNLEFVRQEIENVVSPDSVIPTASTSSTHNRSSKAATPKGDEILAPQPSQSVMTDNFVLSSIVDITPLAPPPADDNDNLPLPDDTTTNNEDIQTNVDGINSQDDDTHEQHEAQPKPHLSPAQSHDEQHIPIISSSPIIPVIQQSQAHNQDEPDVHFNANSTTVERHDSASEPAGSSSPVDFDITINGSTNVIPPFNLAHSDAGGSPAGAVDVGLYGDVIPANTQFTSATSPPAPVNVDANGDVIPSTNAQFNVTPRFASNPPGTINVNVNGDMIPPLNPQFDPTTSNIYAFMEDDGGGPEFFDNSTTPVRHPNNGAPFEAQREAEDNGPGESGAGFLFNEQKLDSPTNHSGLQEGRVEASKMGQVENPLQKRGRHTVITGHLPEDNPYAVAEKNLGVKMCSLKWMGTGVVGLSKEEAFARDLQQFLVEIHLTGYKVPVIGGGLLDLFALMREVLLLGGVTNVVKKRAFRIVGQQLELPKSCTSAAFVLKNAYTRLLFYYERKLVFDEMPPENPARNVNIKQIVAADKERDKMEAKLRNGAARSNANNHSHMNVNMGIEMNMSIGNGFRGSDDGHGIGSGNKKRSLVMMNTTTTDSPSPSPSSYILDNAHGSDYGERENSTGRLKRPRYCYPTPGAKAGLLNDNMNSNINTNGIGIGSNVTNVAEKDDNIPEITPMGSAADYLFSQDYYMSLLSWVGLD